MSERPTPPEQYNPENFAIPLSTRIALAERNAEQGEPHPPAMEYPSIDERVNSVLEGSGEAGGSAIANGSQSPNHTQASDDTNTTDNTDRDNDNGSSPVVTDTPQGAEPSPQPRNSMRPAEGSDPFAHLKKYGESPEPTSSQPTPDSSEPIHPQQDTVPEPTENPPKPLAEPSYRGNPNPNSSIAEVDGKMEPGNTIGADKMQERTDLHNRVMDGLGKGSDTASEPANHNTEDIYSTMA